MITDAEDYFAKGCGRCARFATPDCSVQHWRVGVVALRQLCLEAGLTETAKWGHPCYMHAGRNVAMIGAFRDTYRLTFFDAALPPDPAGILERRSPNSRAADQISLTDPAAVAAMAPVLRDYLAAAKAMAELGRPARPPVDLTLPEELLAALDADAELATAFHALTPGRQRSWALHLTTSANPATRRARIDKGRAKIMAGKGATER
jgi:uncharacterized protein YdeI (YjbR/CyaY-like superfamily)